MTTTIVHDADAGTPVVEAESVTVSYCTTCNEVHIMFWRDGEIFAAATPHAPETVVRMLVEAIILKKQAAGGARPVAVNPNMH